MTIELALSALAQFIFYALAGIFIIGLGLVLGMVIIYWLIKALIYMLKITKGGIEDLKKTVKAIA